MLVVDEGNQKMFEGRILVPAAAGFSQRIVQGLFEFASETRHLDGDSPPDPMWPGFQNQCHTRARRNQEARLRLSPDYDWRRCARGEWQLFPAKAGVQTAA
jgi:hypothetical protein